MATDAALGLYSEETEDAMFSHFGKEVDTLKKEIKKVQANIKSQNVRLKTLDGEIKELNKELDADKQYDDRSEAELQAELNALNEQIANLEAMHSRQLATNDSLRDDLENLKLEKLRLEEEIEKCRTRSMNLKKLISRLQEKNESLQIEKKAAEEVFHKLMSDLSAMTHKLSQLEEDLNMDVSSLQEKILDYKKTIDDEKKYKERFLASINRNVEDMNNMQRQAQEHSINVSLVRAEFAEYCATRDLTSSERVSKGSEEYAALKEEFGQYRQLMLEDRQQMLRETQELLLSVRHQFETYRNTAEEVLAAEMHNIDHHLNMHKRLCDMEIKIYRKESEHLYEDMVSAKNAKILELLQGSAYHAQYFRHQEELQALEREHKRELEEARLRAKEQVEKERILPLQRKIARNEEEIAKYRKELEQCEADMKEALDMYNEAGEKLAAMELKHSRQMQAIEEEADRYRTGNARLQIEIQRLKHQIMRERLGSGAMQLDEELAKAEMQAQKEIEAHQVKEVEEDEQNKEDSHAQALSTVKSFTSERKRGHLSKADLITVVNRVSSKVLDLRTELAPMLSEVEALEVENKRLESAKKAAQRRLRMWDAKVRQEKEALEAGISGLEGVLQRLVRQVSGHPGPAARSALAVTTPRSSFRRQRSGFEGSTYSSIDDDNLPDGDVEALTSYLLGGLSTVGDQHKALQRAHRRLMEDDLNRLAGLANRSPREPPERLRDAMSEPSSARGNGRRSPRLQWVAEKGVLSARGPNTARAEGWNDRRTKSFQDAASGSQATPVPSIRSGSFTTPFTDFGDDDEGDVEALLRAGRARIQQFRTASSAAKAGRGNSSGMDRVKLDPLLMKGSLQAPKGKKAWATNREAQMPPSMSITDQLDPVMTFRGSVTGSSAGSLKPPRPRESQNEAKSLPHNE